MKVVDCWCNPFWENQIKATLEDWDLGRPVKWWHMEDRWRPYTVPEMVSLLDEAGVEKVLIPAMQMKSYLRKTLCWDASAKEVASYVQQRPEKFAGLYGINPEKRLEGVKELEKAVREYGFVGAHLHTYGYGLKINDRAYWPFYAKCVELDVPVIMQVGHSAEMMPSAMARPILMDDIALYFTDLRLIGAHTGWPWVEEAIAVAWKHPNVYLATTAHMPKYWDKSLVQFINTRGKGKVLFGTDFPVLAHKDSLKQVEELGLREDAKALLLRDAALKVFKLK